MPLNASNPALGILIFTLGGIAGAVFYLPFKRPIGSTSCNLVQLSGANGALCQLPSLVPGTHTANDGQYTRDQQKNQRFTHTSALWRELLVPGFEKSLLV